MAQDFEHLRKEFEGIFGGEPEVMAFAPGRVNIIGEHTDYHDGFVFPFAIELGQFVAARKRHDDLIRVFSKNLARIFEARIGEIDEARKVKEGLYLFAPVWVLKERGLLESGFEIFAYSNVPFGEGLSSSAACEVSVLGALNALFGLRIDEQEIARLGQIAENKYVGAPCGIMDQMASACSREGCAIFLDCRSLTFEHCPVPDSIGFLIAPSGVKHSVAGGEYKRRQEECERGMKLAPARAKKARDLSEEDLERMRPLIDEVAFKRLRHVVSENKRVLEAKEALLKGDNERLGALLLESHKSLRDDYEVSSYELDCLVEVSMGIEGVYGARLTGAGFGGNVIVACEKVRTKEVASAIEEGFFERTKRRTFVRTVRPSRGLTVYG